MAKSKKVNKWEAAPEGIRRLKDYLRFLLDKLEVRTYDVDDPEYKELVDEIFKGFDKALDDYNELEAKHNADCGLISKLEEEVKTYETLTAGLHNDADELERTINNLEEMVEYHKDEVKKLVEAADMVRDKHENDVCMLKKDIHDLEVKVKYYKEDNDDLECEVSKYKALYEGLESTVDSITRERNHFEYILSQLIEQLKIKNDVYVDINECIDGNYKVENKRAADLQEDLDAAILDLKKEEENCERLNRKINRKDVEMCNLKWEHDETEKKIKILIDKLQEQYNIKVTFYQKPGIDMYGLRNFGVHVDCEENRKAFDELKEALDKHKSQIEKLETKHAKATRFIARLTEALNEAGVTFHYFKFGGDGEEIFYIDSLIDKLAKKHYGEQIRRFKNDISELQAKIYKLEEDRKEIEHRNLLLLKALDRAGISPTFDSLNDRCLIQYTDKAVNAFLAADQIKRDAEKKIGKLVSALDKCRLDAKWDHENDKWCIYVQPSDTELTSVSVNLCEVVEGYEKLKEENKTLISERDDLKSKNRSWQVSYNAVEKKAKEATAVIDGLNDYAEALKGRIQELEDRSKDIYKLAVDGYNNMSVFEYTAIADILRCKHRLACPVVCDCTNCKNYDPKE